MSLEKPKRYAPAWVALHWGIALLLLAEFTLGISSRYIPAGNWKAVMSWHIPLGLSILALMIVRIIVRTRTPHPEPATTGSPFLDFIGVLTHYLLYILVIAMTLVGFSQAISYNLIPIQLGAASNLVIRIGSFHGLIAIALALLISLHVGAALFHQIILKDNLLSRMWFRKEN